VVSLITWFQRLHYETCIDHSITAITAITAITLKKCTKSLMSNSYVNKTKKKTSYKSNNAILFSSLRCSYWVNLSNLFLLYMELQGFPVWTSTKRFWWGCDTTRAWGDQRTFVFLQGMYCATLDWFFRQYAD